MITISCSYCGKEFKTYPSKLKNGRKCCCSPTCYHKSRLGKISWWRLNGLPNPLIKESKRRKGRTYEELFGVEKADLIKSRLSEAHKDQTHTLEQRSKVSASLKGHPYWGPKKFSIESLQKKSASLKGHKTSESTRLKIGTKSKISTKELWKNEEYRKNQVKRILQGWHNKPTKPERVLIHLFNTHGIPYTYNGYEGRVIIGGKVPDFIHNEGFSKVIEVFGRLFHDPNFPRHLNRIPRSKTPLGTVEHYKKHGYEGSDNFSGYGGF